MKNLIYLIFIVCLFSTCNNKKGYIPKSGDLIFRVSENSDFSEAIHKSTGINKKISFSHVGIIYIENDSVYVIDAIPEEGVRKIDLNKFLNESAKTKENKPLVVVYRLDNEIIAKKASQKALKFIGIKYDSAFLPNNDAIYCSELVYECFLNNNKHIFNTIPMNFKDPSSGDYCQFWIEYYKKLNIPIPQNVPGTNPNQISGNKKLKKIYDFY